MGPRLKCERGADDEQGMTRSTDVTLHGAAELARDLWRRLEEMGATELITVERKILSGHLFPDAPELADTVGQALQSEPGLDAERGGVLLARQERAHVFAFLRDQLLQMAQVCHDTYIKEQAQAADEAVRIVRPLMAPDGGPPADLDRLAPLLVPVCLLEERFAATRRSKPKGRRPPLAEVQEKRARDRARLLAELLRAIGRRPAQD
jgi:hypothetical protein